MTTKKKTVKRTGTRVAKLAAQYLDMDDEQLYEEMFGGSSACYSHVYRPFNEFCKKFRAICASALSQTEPGPKGRKK